MTTLWKILSLSICICCIALLGCAVLPAYADSPVNAPDCVFTFEVQSKCTDSTSATIVWSAHTTQSGYVMVSLPNTGQHAGPYDMLPPAFNTHDTLVTSLSSFVNLKVTFQPAYWTGHSWANLPEQQVAIPNISCTPTALTLATFSAQAETSCLNIAGRHWCWR